MIAVLHDTAWANVPDPDPEEDWFVLAPEKGKKDPYAGGATKRAKKSCFSSRRAGYLHRPQRPFQDSQDGATWATGGGHQRDKGSAEKSLVSAYLA